MGQRVWGLHMSKLVLITRSGKWCASGRHWKWSGRQWCEWGTPLTCQRDGVGTLVRGQKFTLVRGRRPRAGQGIAIPVTSHALAWYKWHIWLSKVKFCQRWWEWNSTLVRGDESGFQQWALHEPKFVKGVTGMGNGGEWAERFSEFKKYSLWQAERFRESWRYCKHELRAQLKRGEWAWLRLVRAE